MGLLICVWGIYTELQNCMYQTAHGPCLSQSLHMPYHPRPISSLRPKGPLDDIDHPSGLKALWMILVSRDDTAYDTDFAMYYSLYSKTYKLELYRQTYYYISCIIRQGGQNKRVNENQLLQYQ